MKWLILSILRWSGMLCLWRWWHRNEITILMIHGVMDEEDTTTWVPLRPQLSRRQLDASIRILLKHYRFISLQDAVNILSGRKPFIPYSLVLTFDDGYRNNITHALPILRKYGVPATIFLSTGHIEKRTPFWFDRLDYILQYADVDGLEFTIGGKLIRIDAFNRKTLRQSYKHFRDIAKEKYSNDMNMLRRMDELASELEKKTGKCLADIFENDPWSAVVTWEEVRGAAQEGVTFGSHTEDHIRLGLVNEMMARNQFMGSKEKIEKQTCEPCLYLCYPDGSYNSRVAEMAQKIGYHAAVTTVEGQNRLGDELMTLKRIGFPLYGSGNEILFITCGLSYTIGRLKNLIF